MRPRICAIQGSNRSHSCKGASPQRSQNLHSCCRIASIVASRLRSSWRAGFLGIDLHSSTTMVRPHTPSQECCVNETHRIPHIPLHVDVETVRTKRQEEGIRPEAQDVPGFAISGTELLAVWRRCALCPGLHLGRVWNNCSRVSRRDLCRERLGSLLKYYSRTA